jgi:hypothetical protein
LPGFTKLFSKTKISAWAASTKVLTEQEESDIEIKETSNENLGSSQAPFGEKIFLRNEIG